MSDIRNSRSLTIEKVLSVALQTPGIYVDRDSFLMANFGNDSRLRTMRPIDLYAPGMLDKRAGQCIRLTVSTATVASVIAGIPGGWAALPAGAADIVQFYANTLILLQKLGYIYGWPDLRNSQGVFDENTLSAVMMYLGVAMGVDAANKFIQELAEGAGKAAAKKISNTAVTKTVWYPILKSIYSVFNKELTKEGAQQLAKKVIPLVGAGISGALTYQSFRKAAKRLKKVLEEEIFYSKGLSDHYVFSVLE